MKKKTLTADNIEKKLKEMGGIVVPDKEFDSSDEYKNVSNYVKQVFRVKRKNRKQKVKSVH